MTKKPMQDLPVKKNAFVHKLYSMLSDPKLAHLIWWTRNDESNTFALYPGKEFATALTGYFKHGNVASFVRQLHMYGFHKVLDPQAAPPADLPGDPKDQPPVWEFKHSSGKFKKNDESLLVYIKRRSSSNSLRNSSSYAEHDTSMLIPTSTPSPGLFEPPHPGRGYMFAPPPQQPYVVHGGPVYYHPVPPYVAHGGVPYGAQPPVYQYNPGPVSGPEGEENRSLNPTIAPRSHLDPHNRPRTPTGAVNKLLLGTPGPPQAVHPQHYTPNLQFRKIWENSSHARPRNPSLKFDPLAPAPPHSEGSVKLPPPSLIHRNSLHPSLRGPISPQMAPEPLEHEDRLPRSIPAALDVTPGGVTGSPSQMSKKPLLVPISNAIHERLRPSLIELHFGAPPVPHLAPTSISSAKLTSITKAQSNSIGLHSLHDSIFSNQSLISSILSFQRTSLFGLLSHVPAFQHKSSISIGPHDRPEETQETVSAHEGSHRVENAPARPEFSAQRPDLVSPAAVAGRPRFLRTLTPPNLASKLAKNGVLHQPVPRLSTAFQASLSTGSHLYNQLRPLTTSPLAKSVSERSDGTITNTITSVRSKVSVNSLLGDETNHPNIGAVIHESEESDKAAAKRQKTE